MRFQRRQGLVSPRASSLSCPKHLLWVTVSWHYRLLRASNLHLEVQPTNGQFDRKMGISSTLLSLLSQSLTMLKERVIGGTLKYIPFSCTEWWCFKLKESCKCKDVGLSSTESQGWWEGSAGYSGADDQVNPRLVYGRWFGKGTNLRLRVLNCASMGCHDFGFTYVRVWGFLLPLPPRSLPEMVSHLGRT